VIIGQKLFLFRKGTDLAAKVDAHDSEAEEDHHDYIPKLEDKSVIGPAEESIEESHLGWLFVLDGGANVSCGFILDLEGVVFQGSTTV